MRYAKRSALLLCVLILALARPASTATTAYSIDMILPLTGSAAFAGNSQQQAARVYETVVNKAGGIHGQAIHFEIHDDQTNPAVAVQIANEILQRHPVVVLGPSIAATCSAVAPLFVNGPVNYCFSPVGEPARGGYIFASYVALRTMLGSGYERMRSLGYKRIAALYATDASGQFEQQVTNDWFALPANKGYLVAQETMSPTDISVAAQVSKIKAASPDMVFVWAIGGAFGTVIRELANAGIDVPTVTSPSNGSEAQLIQYKAFLPKTLVIQGMPFQGKLQSNALKSAAAEFVNAMKDAGIKPEPIQASAWDPMRLTVMALRNLPANATAAQLHDYLEGLHDFAGVWGTYDFRSGNQHGIEGKDIPYIHWDTVRGVWTYFESGPKG